MFKMLSLRMANDGKVGSTCCTLAASDTESQLPPVSLKCPLPIRLRISFGVSSGPLANGVKLVNGGRDRAFSGCDRGATVMFVCFFLMSECVR